MFDLCNKRSAKSEALSLNMVTITTFGALINFVLWGIAFLYYQSAYKKINKSYILFFILASVSFTFNNLGLDYIAYADIYSEMSWFNTPVHVESFYFWLMKVFPYGYHFWRFLIWGLGLFFMICSFKKMKTNPAFTCLIFTLILFFSFGTSRNALGFSVFYLGISILFFSKKNQLLGKILGLFLIFCSSFLHKSMFFFILLYIVSLIPIKKKLFFISVLAFPIIYKVLTLLSVVILNAFATDVTLDSGMRYLESDFRVDINISGMIQQIINKLPIFLLLFYAMRNIVIRKENIPYNLVVFLQYTYWLVYVSLLFLGQEVSAFLSNRFWDASLFSLTIFLTAYLYDKPRTKFIKICFYLLLLSNLYNFSYSIYKTF